MSADDTAADRTIWEKKAQNAHDKNFLKNTPIEFQAILGEIRDFTMLSRERLSEVYNSTEYVISNDVPGDFVEVGCWAGGCVAMVQSLMKRRGAAERLAWGFDTFEGHNRPNDEEFDVWGVNQADVFDDKKSKNLDWGKSDLDSVKRNLLAVNGTLDGARLVKGNIEVTSKTAQIDRISVLRIDVDWYEPTKASLDAFWPLLAKRGMLIVDDYGHHSGAKKAVDEFFKAKPIKWFYTDYSCICAMKLDD